MKNLIKKLEEQITFLQQEVSQISDEGYKQQKEILILKTDVKKLKDKINDIQNVSDIQNIDEEKLPPHY
jgi:SlyX protein